jgi:HNH endonuclease
MTELPPRSKATAGKFARAMTERAGKLRELPPVDYVVAFVAEAAPLWHAAIPRVDEPLVRSGSWSDGTAIELEYYRPILGPGRDFVWRVSIDAVTAKVRLSMGDFSPDLLFHTRSVLSTRLGVLATLLDPVARRQPSLGLFMNSHRLEVTDLVSEYRDGSRIEIDGPLESLAIELSLTLQDAPERLVGDWVTEAVSELVPVYLAITPPLAALFLMRDESEEQAYPEGAVHYRLHRVRERDPRVIAEAKRLFREAHNGRLFCEVCDFDFELTYGKRGEGFAEGHHTRLISEMQSGEATRPSDIAILCSNCHSMIHRPPLLSPIELRTALASA